jgi:ubiquinone/menaquinone biosynthesis C-methylase UbiE
MSLIERNNYDHAAGFYDRLARLIFGAAIRESQFSLLRYHFPGSSIVIVGGGTGEILEELGKLKTDPLKITFIELSEKMLRKARKKKVGCHQVKFIKGDVEHFSADDSFDVVITPFLFDNFTAEKASGVFNHLNGMLNREGIWLFTDFYLSSKSPWWHRFLLKCMYRFFRMLARVEASQLPDTDSLFANAAYSCEQETFFYHNFIRSAVYRKSQVVF